MHRQTEEDAGTPKGFYLPPWNIVRASVYNQGHSSRNAILDFMVPHPNIGLFGILQNHVIPASFYV